MNISNNKNPSESDLMETEDVSLKLANSVDMDTGDTSVSEEDSFPPTPKKKTITKTQLIRPNYRALCSN